MLTLATTKRLSLLRLLLLLLVGSLAVGLTQRAVRREQLRRALADAVQRGDTQKAQAILAHGADPNARDSGLSLSSWEYFLRRIQGKRMPYNPRPNATVLMLAAERRSSNLVRLLLEHGADPNLRDDRGCTALMYAARSYHCPSLRLLLDHGADARLRADDGSTPLRTAASGTAWYQRKILTPGVAIFTRTHPPGWQRAIQEYTTTYQRMQTAVTILQAAQPRS